MPGRIRCRPVMFRPVRREAFVTGVVVGAAVSRNRARPVVVETAYPGCYPAYPVGGSTTVIYSNPAQPPPPQTVYVQQPQQPQQPAYPPQQPAYPPQQPAYPPQQPAYPPQQPAYPPQPYQQPGYPPAGYPPPYANQGPPPPVGIANAPPPSVEMKESAVIIPVQKERRYFVVVNEANCQLLEIEKRNSSAGAKVVSEKRRADKPSHQIWYLDENDVIRSKLNDYAMQSKENGGFLCTVPYTGDARQQWILQGNRLVNKVFCNDCIALKKGMIRIKDDVIVEPYHGKPWQHWRVEYIT